MLFSGRGGKVPWMRVGETEVTLQETPSTLTWVVPLMNPWPPITNGVPPPAVARQGSTSWTTTPTAETSSGSSRRILSEV